MMRSFYYGDTKHIFFTSNKRVKYTQSSHKTKNIIDDLKESRKTEDIQHRVISKKHPAKVVTRNIYGI